MTVEDIKRASQGDPGARVTIIAELMLWVVVTEIIAATVALTIRKDLDPVSASTIIGMIVGHIFGRGSRRGAG